MGKSGQAFCLIAGAVLLAGAMAPFFKLTAASM